MRPPQQGHGGRWSAAAPAAGSASSRSTGGSVTGTGMAISSLARAIFFFVVALAALLAFAEWEEWINLLLGVWVAVSAWAVGFAVHTTATWVHVVTGIIVAV